MYGRFTIAKLNALTYNFMLYFSQSMTLLIDIID